MAARRCDVCRHDWPATLRNVRCPWCGRKTVRVESAVWDGELPAAAGELAELASEIAILELDARLIAPHMTWVDMLERRHL